MCPKNETMPAERGGRRLMLPRRCCRATSSVLYAALQVAPPLFIQILEFSHDLGETGMGTHLNLGAFGT